MIEFFYRNRLSRPARIEDADVPAELVYYAGEGPPSYLCHKIAGPGETAQEVGRKMKRE